MFESLLLLWQQTYQLAFYSIFRTTPEISSKLYFVEIRQVSEKVWLFNHIRVDFWLLNFGFKRSLLSLLNAYSFLIHTINLIYLHFLALNMISVIQF